uniref:Uncharacterized protein n=1 Tax=Amphimedon queenslandica TaxID=400682 RepID=A0A1X7VEI2_AMPQE
DIPLTYQPYVLISHSRSQYKNLLSLGLYSSL